MVQNSFAAASYLIQTFLDPNWHVICTSRGPSAGAAGRNSAGCPWHSVGPATWCFKQAIHLQMFRSYICYMHLYFTYLYISWCGDTRQHLCWRPDGYNVELVSSRLRLYGPCSELCFLSGKLSSIPSHLIPLTPPPTIQKSAHKCRRSEHTKKTPTHTNTTTKTNWPQHMPVRDLSVRESRSQ